MIAEQLKKAVLQAAIQGKLTRQLPEDGDARDLMKEIKAEKARLVKEGKLKNEIPLSPITDDNIPFDIPENWVWCNFQDIIEVIQYGYTSPAISVGHVKMLRITDIQEDMVDWDKVPFCTITDDQLSTYRLKNRDIVVARTGGTVGKTYLIKETYPDSVFASYLIRLVFSIHIQELFIKYFMESPLYWQQLIDESQGTGQPNVNSQALKRLLLPLPPLTEQNRIVEQLAKVLPEIDKLALDENKLYELEKVFPKKMKDAILQYAIQGKLTDQRPEAGNARDLLKEIRTEKARLVKAGKLKKETPLPEISEDEKPFDIPENWTWCRLNEIVWLGNGEKKAGLTLPYLEARVLRGQENGSYKTSGEVVFSGERVILVDGENSGEVFKIPHDGYLGSTYKKLFFASENVIPYILFFLKKYQNLFKNNKTGSAIPHLNKSLFRELLIPLPPLTEQQRIVERLEHLLPLCEKLE